MNTYIVTLLLTLGLSACAGTRIATWDVLKNSGNPQAVVDSSDAIRARNEAAVWRNTVNVVASYYDSAASRGVECPYVEVERHGLSQPATFAVLGNRGGTYHKGPNAVVYPLGSHTVLAHEYAHAVVYQTNPTVECMLEVFPLALQRLLETRLD